MHIIVASTGSYSDAWAPFHALFKKFWADCPYPLTLVTDHEPIPWPGERKIVLGVDRGWCKNLLEALKQIPEDFVLLLQEDFFLNYPTNTPQIQQALVTLKADPKVGAFRVYPCPGPDQPVGEDYGIINPGAAYRVSCQATIWRKAELASILERFNTPREFEIDGTRFASSKRAHMKYFAWMEPDPNKWPLQYYCTAIGRGEWDPNALEFCAKVGVPVDTSKRPTCSGPR